MERPPAPEVTIEGGQGWQLGDGSPRSADPVPETLDAEPAPAPRRLPRGLPLVLAAALGFGAATVMAENRRQTLAETAQGVLSLELRSEPETIGRALVSTADGALAVQTSAVLRNTGPEPVALDRIELVGTPYRSEDLAGRRVAPEQQSVVALLRPVDCTDLSHGAAAGPLRVHATTGTGSRSVDLRMDTEVLRFHDEQVRAVCGQADPLAALIVMEQQPEVTGRTAVLPTQLSNGSAREVVLTSLRARSGLRLVRLEDEQGRPLALPLSLPPGDFDPPVEPFEGRGPVVVVRAVLEVDDCSRLEGQSQADRDLYFPLLEGLVEGADPSGGTSQWGGDPTVVERLREATCAD